jgi:hypothetical protein
MTPTTTINLTDWGTRIRHAHSRTVLDSMRHHADTESRLATQRGATTDANVYAALARACQVERDRRFPLTYTVTDHDWNSAYMHDWREMR